MNSDKSNMTVKVEDTSSGGIPFGQIGWPLLLLPLIVLPFDVITMMYWMFCGIAAFYSALVLPTKLLMRIYRRWRRANKPDWSRTLTPDWQTELRPLLTVILFAAAVAVHFIVEELANRYKNDISTQLQHLCKEQGKCPAVPEGWQEAGGVSKSSKWHWNYVYVTNETKSEFILQVYMAYESLLCIHGGTFIFLNERRSLSSCTREFNSADGDSLRRID